MNNRDHLCNSIPKVNDDVTRVDIFQLTKLILMAQNVTPHAILVYDA